MEDCLQSAKCECSIFERLFLSCPPGRLARGPFYELRWALLAKCTVRFFSFFSSFCEGWERNWCLIGASRLLDASGDDATKLVKLFFFFGTKSNDSQLRALAYIYWCAR